ncbi:peptide deformylase [Kiloniella spongiae]|uniref:Peptide deformylase n=1 Tax=Kiloniella spongiae TaxID=1489064 RepID=A0A0H2MIX7_9PROT|nr:peptide deformylase [Kiloniella spongiae]KLN62141.1 peptide deformylase [Kiloniella spongiae]
MTLLKISKMGHPVLRQVAETVSDPSAPEIRELVENMVETMTEVGGTGIAAPQVFESKRIFVFFVSEERAKAEAKRLGLSQEAEAGVPLTVLVNPEIEFIGNEIDEGWEGCLSIPGLMGKIPRHRSILYRGLGLDGKLIEREATGFHARVVQHEYDHLDGVLYPERISDIKSLIFSSEVGYQKTDAG